MKTIEYPITEMVSVEMSKDKTWFVRYNTEHECFPQIHKKTKYGDKLIRNKKGYKDFVWSVSQFCKEHNFLLEGEGRGMVMGHYLRKIVYWDDKEVLCYLEPRLLYPQTQTRRCVFKMVRDYPGGTLLPYYGNPHYKKYIEDNNGECLLPLPEDVKWWIV